MVWMGWMALMGNLTWRPVGANLFRCGPCGYAQKLSAQIFHSFVHSAGHRQTTMELLPAHQPFEDDTDEDLSDEQIRELLNEAAARMRAKADAQPVSAPDAPFKLPKLKPGHIADTCEKTDGNITRLDHAKLIDKKQLALANGIKKIDDPLEVKKHRKEVCPKTYSFYPLLHAVVRRGGLYNDLTATTPYDEHTSCR